MKVVVFGGTGVIGRAAAQRFVDDGAEVVTVSRRDRALDGVRHAAIDLSDPAAGRAAAQRGVYDETTHVVFAALQEAPDLVSGWHDRTLMEHNLRLFEHALEPLIERAATTLAHVSLLQGAKAYGLHVGRTPVPAKERAPRDDHANFYFLQEDTLRRLAAGARWSWTVLRPQVVYGESFGSPMNLLPAIGAYAAVERARGRPLSFPGGAAGIHEAVDARLLARVLAWAATSSTARGEIFNVTNGDVFSWPDVWPTIAAALDMEVGDPVPQLLAEVMPPRGAEWAALVDRHRLAAPRDLAAFVGSSWIYADLLFGARGTRALPALLSTVKLRQAGFADCIDTEDMFREWLDRFRHRGLLPP